MVAFMSEASLPLGFILSLLRSHIADVLIREDLWEGLLTLARQMPHGFAFGALEIRLDHCPDVDYQVCALASGRKELSAHLSGVSTGPLCALEPLLRAWLTPGHVVHDGMSTFTAAVDFVRGVPTNAFGDIRTLPYVAYGKLPFPVREEETRKLVSVGLGLLAPDLCLDAQRKMWALLDLAPVGANLVHVTSPTSRVDPPLRFEVSMKPAEVVPFLRRVGWGGDLEQVCTVLLCLPDSVVRKWQIALIIRDGLENRLTLEPIVDRQRAARSWIQIFACAQKYAGALPEKIDELLRWRGRRHFQHRDLHWPVEVFCEYDFKFVFDAGSLSSKAYLVYHPRCDVLGGWGCAQSSSD